MGDTSRVRTTRPALSGASPSPVVEQLIRETLIRLKATGVATILVEQRVEAVLSVADSVAFMAQGSVAAIRASMASSPAACAIPSSARS